MFLNPGFIKKGPKERSEEVDVSGN